MKLTKDVIDQIQATMDIVEVVGDFVPLKKKGHYYSACCPFHNEKTPSFTVTPAKGIYKCFGCGKAGDSIQFIMDHEHIGFTEAMLYLANKYNIEIVEEAKTSEESQADFEKESLLVVSNFAKDYFVSNLWNTEEGKNIGYSYFKERGFREETIKKFELGYSLDQWDAFTSHAIKEGHKSEYLTKTGLSIERDQKTDEAAKFFDRFRARVMFPIHGVTGRVIGFGARILKNDKTQAKYLNSPESAIYHKSKILYGLFQSKQGIRKNDECFLVEGYTDVISLHQADVDNVVASSGTSLTEDQIRLIKRYTSNITVLYDGDAAGIKASIRGIDLILEQDMNVSVVLFPDGEDPDSYVKKIGPAAFIEYIKANKENFITFKTKLALKEANNDPFKRAEVIKDIIESISKIPDGIKRAVFFKECSTLLAIDEQTLITEYNKKLQANKSKASKDAHFSEREIEEVLLPSEFYEENSLPLEEQSLQLHERDVLKYLINHLTDNVENDTSLVAYMMNELLDIEFKNPIYARIMQEIKTLHEQNSPIQESFFIQHSDPEIKKTVIDLLSNKYTISENWSNFHIVVPKDIDILNSIVPKTILRFKRVLLKCLIKDNLKEIDRIQKSGNEEELVQALKVAIELKMLSKEVDKMLGIVVG